jgi:hypothetical protein
MPNGQNLGAPIDFTGYVVGRLTRDNPGAIPNFNLDSDRGYGYLCWDWVRDSNVTALPDAYKHFGHADHHYKAPKAPGYGWAAGDVTAVQNGATPAHEHDPKSPSKVEIRYIDKGRKFG